MGILAIEDLSTIKRTCLVAMLHQRKYNEEQQRKRALMKESLVKSVALKKTTTVVSEHLQHTLRWQAVAEKYVEYIWLINDELLVKY